MSVVSLLRLDLLHSSLIDLVSASRVTPPNLSLHQRKRARTDRNNTQPSPSISLQYTKLVEVKAQFEWYRDVVAALEAAIIGEVQAQFEQHRNVVAHLKATIVGIVEGLD